MKAKTVVRRVGDVGGGDGDKGVGRAVGDVEAI